MTTPPLPPGFVLEEPQQSTAMPPLPPGFELIQDDEPGLEIDIVGGTPESQAGAAERPDFSGVTARVDSTATGRTPDGWKPGMARDVMFGARSVIQGAGGLLGMVGGDAFNNYIVNPVARAVGAQEARPYREEATALADRLGLPKAQTASDRVLGDVGEALTGTGLTMGAGGALNALARMAPGATASTTSRVGNLLTTQPVGQTVSAAGGSGAAGITRESGGSQGQQLVAGLAGGLGPGLAATGGGALARLAVRGTDGSQMRSTLADFQALGAQPSVGQASGNRLIQGAENLLAGGPTSAGVMNRFSERQADDIGAGLHRMADGLSANASAERAGRAINTGVRGDGGFLQSTRKVADELYDKLREHIPSDSRVDVSNVREALADLNASIPGAPSVSRFFQNARLEGIEGALAQDAAGVSGVLSRPGMAEAADGYRAYLKSQADAIAKRNADRRALGMNNLEPVPSAQQIEAEVQATLANMVDNRLPYEALQKLRTLVGNEIEGSSLLSDVPRSKWKAVYGALTRDMEAAATTPQAKQALARANAYFNARVKRIDAIDHVIEKHGGPEKVYQAAMSGTKDGGTTLRAVMQSLPKDGQRAVTAAVIKRMGMPTAGQAGADAAEQFSAATFLTNWNRVSPEARRALFDRHGPEFSRNMDRIARVAANLKDGAKVFANPSGTANRAAAMSYALSVPLSIGQSLYTGHHWPIVATIGGGIAANVVARGMTSPLVVGFLANSTRIPAGSINASIQGLARAAERRGDEAAAEYAQALSEQANGTPEQGAQGDQN